MLKKICAFLMFFHLFFTINSAHSAENFSGSEISDKVQKTLITAGFSPLITNLITPSAGNFSYNLSIDFFPKGFSPESIFSEYKTYAVFVFRQNDFLENSDKILDFLTSASAQNFTIPLSVLFVPPESETLNKNYIISGAENYADNLLAQDNIFAVSVKFEKSEISKIMPGNGREVSPLWLVKQLANSFNKAEEDYVIPAGTFLTMYRYNLIENDRNEESFLAREIPAVSVSASKNCNIDKVFSDFLETYKYEQSANWDRHYFFLKLPGKNFNIVLNESILIKLYLAFAILVIFTLCTFSIIAKERLLRASKEIEHLFFILPLSIFLAALSLSAGKIISTPLALKFHISPVFQLYLKVQISFAIITIIFSIYSNLTKHHTPFAYSFYANLASVINIFIFTSIDLSFFFLFALEYIFISFIKPDKKLAFYSAIGILLFTPLIPYGIILWQSIKIEQVPFIVLGNGIQNILMALAVQPFNMLWLFILSLIIKKRGKKSFKFVAKRTVTLFLSGSAALFLCFLGISAILQSFRKIPSIADIKNNVILKSSEEKNLYLAVLDKSSFGNTVREVLITSEKQAERYEISISGETRQPVYEATVPYIEESGNTKSSVRLPDFPPKSCMFIYTTTSKEKELVTVSAYFSTPEKDVFEVETKMFEIGQDL